MTRRWKDGTENTSWNDYDAADRLVRRGYPDKTFLSLRYDTHGQLAALGPIVPELQWTPDGALSSMKLGNGVVDARGYDRRRRLEQMTAQDLAGTAIRDLKLTLDVASRITHVEDLRPSVPATESQSASYTFDDRYRLRSSQDALATTTWSLDDVAKIVSVTSGHSASWLNLTNTYGEDGVGSDQLTHHGDEAVSYDAAGRVTKDGERVLEWDAKGRLAKVTRGDVVEEYTYAFDDERVVKRTTKGGTTSTVRYAAQDIEERSAKFIRYVFVGNQRIARLDGLAGEAPAASAAPASAASGGATGAWISARKLALGPRWLCCLAVAMSGLVLGLLRLKRRRWVALKPAMLVARLAAWATCVAALSLFILPSCSCEDDKRQPDKNPRNGATEVTEVPASAQFYLGDWQESPVVLVDAKGGVTSRTAYHPYGSTRNTVGQNVDPWGYVGNERDDGAGLGDFHARPYQAESGVFLAPDPVGTFEVEKTVEKPAGAFTYVYGEGDPVDVVDRDGRCGTPYAMPGTGCVRNMGPQLPKAAQQENDRGMLKGWLLAAEVTSYAYGVGEIAAGVRTLRVAIRARGLAAVARGLLSKVAGRALKTAAKEAGAAAKGEAAPALKTTAHGAERIAGAGATRGGVLSTEQIASVRAGGRTVTQADGATVRILTENGRSNVVVEGERGIITTFQNLSDKSLARLAKNYGWKAGQ